MSRIISLRNRDVIANDSRKVIFNNTRLRCIIVASSTGCQCRKLVSKEEALLGGIRCTWHIKTLQVSFPKSAPCAKVVVANILSEEAASPASGRLHPQRRLCEFGEQPFRRALASLVLAILPGVHGSNVFGLHC